MDALVVAGQCLHRLKDFLMLPCQCKESEKLGGTETGQLTQTSYRNISYHRTIKLGELDRGMGDEISLSMARIQTACDASLVMNFIAVIIIIITPSLSVP